MEDSFALGYAMGTDSNNNNGGGNNNGWGDSGFLWIIVIFALLFGWGNNGNRGNGGNNGGGDGMAAYIPYLASAVNANGAVTRADLCSEFAFNDLNRAVEGLNNGLCNGFYTTSTQINNGFAGVNNAICSLGYNNAQLANGINNTVMQGFNSANVVALQNQNAVQTQIADCCCGIQRGIDGINYNMATNTCALQNTMNTNTRDIIDATNAGTRAVLDYLCQEKIADLQNENQGLRLAASQTAQNQYLISQLRPFPVAAYQVCNPFTGTYGGYQGYGCACNNGCGC